MKLGLYLNMSHTKGRMLLRGIHAELENWPEMEVEEIPHNLRLWEGNPLDNLDALMGEFETNHRMVPFQHLKVPVISLSHALDEADYPRSVMDEERIGRLAARHLMERGYERFICLVMWEHHAASRRAEAFRAEISRQGREAEILKGSFISKHWDVELIVQAIDRAKVPVGIFGWTDFAAYAAFMAARRMGKRIPEEVGIMGSGNDDVYTSITSKPMTSIALNWESAGAAAVEMLREAMDGRRPADRYCQRCELLPRASTERYPVSDPRVARCLSLIERDLAGELSIPVLAGKVGCSKRSLEEHFRKELKTSPARYILERRIRRAKRLLRETGLRIYEVATACGFEDANYFAIAFKRVTNMSPTEFRDGIAENS